MLIRFNKPYGVLSQFTPEGRWQGLRDYIDEPGVYAAGRLDADSEGLLLLTDDGRYQAELSSPKFKLEKTYWVQVDGEPNQGQLDQLSRGVPLKDGMTLPAVASQMTEPAGLWPRDPPVRFRKNQPTHWLSLTIREGRNRQVRRMTAAVGLPTLRLIRYAIGPYTIDALATGEWEVIAPV
jgi:23S rRNA pseudouridine2457 synthase